MSAPTPSPSAPMASSRIFMTPLPAYRAEPPPLDEGALVRLPSGRFATIVAVYTGRMKDETEVLVRAENGDEFRIRACHLRTLP